jgi:sulfur carrier protein
MAELKNFLLNGQQYSIKREITISNLIDYFNYDNSLLVLEYNNVICNKKNWENIYIKHQDKIEIVTIVGGG